MTRTSNPAIPVVVFAEPDVQRTRALLRAWRGHGNRLAISVPPDDPPRLDDLAAAVLDAMGKIRL